MDEAASVELAVFDVGGRRVATLLRGPRATGEHTLTWDGHDERGRRLSAGVYRLEWRVGGGRSGPSHPIVLVP